MMTLPGLPQLQPIVWNDEMKYNVDANKKVEFLFTARDARMLPITDLALTVSSRKRRKEEEEEDDNDDDEEGRGDGG